jgi:prepilin-type processing-associated H-X9-DG protein
MAITTITNAMVSVNAIQGTLIADNAITAVHIATNAVSGTLIADNAVTATHIAQNTITVTQLADDAVEADKIADGVITTNHLNKAMISSQTEVTAVGGDFVLIGDTSDSNNLKKALVSDFGNNLDAAVTINESGASVDFRVESNTNANMLFVDGSADAVGIGTTSPSATLDVTSTAQNVLDLETTNSDGPLFTFINNGTVRGYIGNAEGAMGLGTANFAIRAQGSLHFGTNGNNERMRILSTGDVLIGQTSQTGYTFAEKLVVGDGDANDGITIQSGSTHQGNLAFNHSDGTTAYGRILYQHNTNYMSFFTNNTERMTINSSGHVIAPSLNQTGSTNNRYPLYWVHNGTVGSLEPYTGSVRAMKTDIADMGSVNWIYSLTPRSFKFRDYTTDSEGNRTYLETTNDLPNTEYGLIAEEVDSVSGSDYILDKDSDDNVKGVLYHNLVPILLKSIQELEARIKTLEG